MFLELANACLGGLHAAHSFKREGTRHNADRQRAAFLGDLRDNRRRACACAAAHARGDEDHIRAFQHVIQFVCGFFGGFAADLRVAARAETAGELLTEPDASRALSPASGPARRCSPR